MPIPYNATFNQVDVGPYLLGPGTGTPITPGEELSMKDTWVCPPSEVSSFLIKWTQENDAPYIFDASEGPGYVWHCHILEHEENAMMRELHPMKPTPTLIKTNIALWLDGLKQQAYGPVVYTNMMPVLDHWADQSGLGNNAVQPDINKQPMHDRYGVSCKEGIMFMPSVNPAYSTSFNIPFSASITTNNTNLSKPVVDSKDLYVVFSPSMLNDKFYKKPKIGWKRKWAKATLDGVQTIFEAGGSNSGFNICTDGTSLIFGIWNPNQTKYNIFPSGTLEMDKTYLAHLEFNDDTRKVRCILNGSPTNTAAFKGLIKDGTDKTGIGAIEGTTRFVNGSVGTTGQKAFNGDIGEVFLFNNCDATQKASVYNYLNWRFNQNWSYPTSGAPKEGVITLDEDISLQDGQYLSSVYPNPASEYAIIGYQIPSESNVSLKVYDILGNEVASLSNGIKSAGSYQDYLDTQNLPNGIYVYKLTSGGFFDSKSFIVSK